MTASTWEQPEQGKALGARRGRLGRLWTRQHKVRRDRALYSVASMYVQIAAGQKAEQQKALTALPLARIQAHIRVCQFVTYWNVYKSCTKKKKLKGLQHY